MVLGRRVPSGAGCPSSRSRTRGSGTADSSVGRVVLHKPAGDAWRGSGGREKRIVVKPSSERSERGLERRVSGHREASRGVDRKHLPREVLLVEASLSVHKALPFTGRRWKRAWPKRRKESRKGAPDEAEATGRQRFGHAKQIRVDKTRLRRWSAEAGRFAVNETLDRGAEGFRSPRESIAGRNGDERR